MKIHIVQRGDTLWELARKYGVDFEALKAANSHLSSPDMIMPGMKIRIPTAAKAVKKEGVKEAEVKGVKKEGVKEAQVKGVQTEVPFKDISPKPMPVIKEDDLKPVMEIKPEMPMPQMPQIPQMTMPLMMPTLDQEYVLSASEEIKEQPIKEQPVKEQPIVQPIQQPVQQPMFQPIHQPIQMIPCYPVQVHPCCCGPFPMHPVHMMPHMGHPPQVMPTGFPQSDCGCGGGTNFGTINGDCGCGGGMNMGLPMGEMPQLVNNPMEFQGQEFNMPVQMEPNMTFPSMSGFNENSFPTPPGFGELRIDNEEESSD